MKTEKLCKPHCYRGGPKKSDACAHARVSVYKRKSNFAFFKVEMAAFLLDKRIENVEFFACYDNKKQQNEMRKKEHPKKLTKVKL